MRKQDEDVGDAAMTRKHPEAPASRRSTRGNHFKGRSRLSPCWSRRLNRGVEASEIARCASELVQGERASRSITSYTIRQVVFTLEAERRRRAQINASGQAG